MSNAIETIVTDLGKLGWKAMELVAEFGTIELVAGACVGFIVYAAYATTFKYPRTYCG